MSRVIALKFLGEGGVGTHSGYRWPLPTKQGRGYEPGKWVSCTGKLEACSNGIHACTPEQAFEWLADECYLIELGGAVQRDPTKYVARKGRLLRPLPWRPRLFAAECAEHVLPIFERAYPNDDRPRRAIQAARDFDAGLIGYAARSAAGSAAGDAARSAAGYAAGYAAGDAVGSAEYAAGDAAGSAAGSAAGDAARDAAWSAARDAAWSAAWSAAGYAAGSAAGYAAGSAGFAAGSAAGDAAFAAWDVAWSSERGWQLRLLLRHLKLRKGWDR